MGRSVWAMEIAIAELRYYLSKILRVSVMGIVPVTVVRLTILTALGTMPGEEILLAETGNLTTIPYAMQIKLRTTVQELMMIPVVATANYAHRINARTMNTGETRSIRNVMQVSQE